MQFRAQDRAIVTVINRFGWSTSELITDWGFYTNQGSAQRRLKQLLDEGLLEKTRIFRNRCSPFWPTKQGADFSASPLTAPRSGPALQDFEHDEIVQKVAIELTNQRPECWGTERECWSQKHADNSWAGRVPDGVLKTTDPPTIIEVENSRKAPDDLARIARKEWGRRSGYRVAWIGTSDGLVKHLKTVLGDTHDNQFIQHISEVVGRVHD